LESALALLRILSKEQWFYLLYEKRTTGKSDKVENNEPVRDGDLRNRQHLASQMEQYADLLSFSQGENREKLVANDYNYILVHLALSSHMDNNDLTQAMLKFSDFLKAHLGNFPGNIVNAACHR
jgi:hypothetical protein